MRQTGKLLVVLAAVAGPALHGLARPEPAAAASAYQQVLRVYQANAAIPPCRFSAPELQRALGGVDTYGAQYFADFTNAVQAALTARAAGACGPAPAARRPTGAGGPSSDAVARLPSVTAPTSAGVPVPLVVLAALAVAGALGGGVARARALARSSRDGHRATDDLPT
ncbi:MAG TPA: hypothetical protein VHW96_04405 [Solirubrobacteraceae bacterium]|nr:hypothetical protein [Solirubrobacteraceae bacterium]